MGMDRNTLIGFGLIGVLLIAMFAINSRNKSALDAQNKHIADSIAAAHPAKPVDSIAQMADQRKADSSKTAQQTKGFVQDTVTQLVSMENEVMKVTFSTKGAQPAIVMLKKFKRYDSTNVLLQTGKFNKLSYTINNGIAGVATETESLNFKPSAVRINADKSQTISFTTGDSSGNHEITHEYTLRPDDYMMDLNITTKGQDMFTQNMTGLTWQTEAEQAEEHHAYELTQSQICYVKDGDYDFAHAGKEESTNSESFENTKTDWIAVKQQFFITSLIAKDKFSSGNVTWKVPGDSSEQILQADARMRVPVNNGAIALQLYYGPSDYNVLKKYNNQSEKIVPYGSGPFAFVKYINRYFLLPVFDFLQKNIASMGIVILLVTLLIRLITSPILYKSYLSGAKMKLLKPEVDALKEKHKDKSGQMDQQAFSMDQMKLWKSAGVSPLGGCLPALLQIPIFMSLYYFFQSNIDLRGKSFLWAKDLAAYDSIYHIPFNIPLYGDHVSLFTLTAVATSLLISIYSMSNMQDNSNPLMKYMPYIFPILLLGVFNRLPAALTWYYTVSNTITLLLQIFIQKYVINHEKILADINEKRKQPVKKSKLAERMEAMQESQRKLQELKKKSSKN